MSLEQGKPLPDARGEVEYGASFIKWFAEQGKRTFGETIPATSPNAALGTIKEPIGIAALITPWNFPVGDDHPQGRRRHGRRLPGDRQARRRDAVLGAGTC